VSSLRRYQIIILLNIVLIGLGIFLSFRNVKYDANTLENQCLIPLLHDIHYENEDFDTLQTKYEVCVKELIIEFSLFYNQAIELQDLTDFDETTIQLSSNDQFLYTNTSIQYTAPNFDDNLQILSYKYTGDHIPYMILTVLLIILTNTVFYLFDQEYDKKYSMRTMLNPAGSALVIYFLLTNAMALQYLDLIAILTYLIVIIGHYYIIKSTKFVAYNIKAEDLEMEQVHEYLTKNHIALQIYKRVNFSGNYYTVRVETDQVDGLKKMLDDVLPVNRRLYFYINLGLISVIHIVALIYLVQYFMN
jgi:hypothetical protein